MAQEIADKIIVMYIKNSCPYCAKAKYLLNFMNLEFKEINITGDMDLMNEMMTKSNGARTVPQIFIGEKYIGGCDTLYALNQSGELDSILNEYYI